MNRSKVAAGGLLAAVFVSGAIVGGAALAALRERDKALRHVNVALSRRPNFPRAIRLKKRLDPTYRPGGSGGAGDVDVEGGA